MWGRNYHITLGEKPGPNRKSVSGNFRGGTCEWDLKHQNVEAGAIGQKLMCHLSLCFSTHMMCQAKVRHMGCICVPARNFHPLTFPTFYPACSVHLLQRVFLHPVPNPALHMPVSLGWLSCSFGPWLWCNISCVYGPDMALALARWSAYIYGEWMTSGDISIH